MGEGNIVNCVPTRRAYTSVKTDEAAHRISTFDRGSTSHVGPAGSHFSSIVPPGGWSSLLFQGHSSPCPSLTLFRCPHSVERGHDTSLPGGLPPCSLRIKPICSSYGLQGAALGTSCALAHLIPSNSVNTGSLLPSFYR